MKAILFILFATVSLPLLAAEDAYEFSDPQQRALFLQLTEELRCPMCQNQNIADSDAMIAHDLRRKVYQLIQEGKGREEIVGYMKDRYGDFVSYRPPVTPLTVWLWLLPVVFIFGAISLVLVQRRKQSNGFDEEKIALAETLLEKEK